MMPPKRLHEFLLVAIVVVLLVYAMSCRTISTLGGAGAGAAAGSLAGPGGAAIGAIAGAVGGDKLADAAGAEKEMTIDQAKAIIANLRAHPVEKYVDIVVDKPFIPRWVWLVVAVFIYSRREHLLGLLPDVFAALRNLAPVDALKATGARLLATVQSGKATTLARTVSANIGDKRRAKLKKSPVTITDSHEGTHGQ